MIRAGDLRWTATIRRPTTNNKGSYGLRDLSDTDYQDVGTFRCSLQDRGTTETEHGNGVFTVRLWEITSRWEAVKDLRQNDRLLVDGKLLAISGISNTENRSKAAVIDAVEVIR